MFILDAMSAGCLDVQYLQKIVRGGWCFLAFLIHFSGMFIHCFHIPLCPQHISCCKNRVLTKSKSALLVNWGTSLYEFIVVASLAQWHGWATRGRHNKIHRDGNSVHWQHLLYKYCSISVSASGSVVVLKMFPCSSSPDSNDQLIIKLCWSLMTSFSSEVLQQRNMYNMLGRPRTRLKHRQCLWWWKPWTITDHWPVRKDAALCSSFNMLHDSKTECRWWKL